MNFKITKEITADVLVVGGGTAGVFAAIAAAKSGADTLLIEKNSMLGGTITTAGVYYPGLFYAWNKRVIDGPCWESIKLAESLGGAEMPEFVYHPKEHWKEQIPLNRFIYVAVLAKMCRDAGVRILTNAMPAACEELSDGFRVIFAEKNGLTSVTAKTAIDTTGDANLTFLTGFGVEKSKVQQPATPHNHISGYDLSLVSEEELKEKYKSASFPSHIGADKLFHYLDMHRIDVHIPCVDADSSAGKTKLEQDSLSLLLDIYKFYRGIKGLENLTIDFIAEETGVRETNRIIGEGTITAEEYINGYLFPDAVCYAFYPIDLHVMDGIEQVFFKEDVVATIPYSALIPKGAKHLLCAGRCISSDTYANSAIRVQAVCMADGQAAGCAAAIASREGINVGDVLYSKLKDALLAIGAVVPGV